MRTSINLNFIVCIIVFPVLMHANNIQVANVSLENQDAGQQHISVEFDISWENSWRTSAIPMNWDAAWVFVKYSVAGGPWAHATLNTTGQVAPSGSSIDVSSDGVGAFIYRSTDGNGTVNWTDARLSWNYGADGVPGDASVEVRVFAIEMVYIPEGSFTLGDGQSTYTFYLGSAGFTTTFQVTSEAEISIGTGAGELYAYQMNNTSAPLAADYPKGYAAFYCMKYEISQEQYKDFLNTLTRVQQNTRTETDISGTFPASYFFYVMSNGDDPLFRNGIFCPIELPPAPAPVTVYNNSGGGATFDQIDDGQNVACNFLNWMDVAAYLDWSGLRPATELEFEKISRGPNVAFGGEYVWGNTNISNVNITGTSILNWDHPDESIINPQENTGMAAYQGIFNYGPMRCGIFAASSPNHSRQETGATYYGVMEMGGNVYEQVVTAQYLAGRSYTGIHGDGDLTSDGDANEDHWPGINGNDQTNVESGAYSTAGVTAAAGASVRGGAWYAIVQYLRISDRSTQYNSGQTTRDYNAGGRGVRTEN